MSNRNRTAGHNWERTCAKRLREKGHEVLVSRAESKNMDDKGVDLFGDSLPFHIQCKNSVKELKYHNLLTSDKLPKDKVTILMHKKTRKSNTNFITEGEYVIMTYDTFNSLF